MSDAFFSRPSEERLNRKRRVVENDQDIQLAETLREESSTGTANFTTLLRDTARAVINKARVVQAVASSLAAESIPVAPDAWSVRRAMEIVWPGSDKTKITFVQYKDAVNQLYANRPDVLELAQQNRAFGLGPAGVTTTHTRSRKDPAGEYAEHLALLLGAYQLIRAVSFPDDVIEDLKKDPPGSNFERIAAIAGKGLLLLQKLNADSPNQDFLRTLGAVTKNEATPEQTAVFTRLLGNNIAAALNTVSSPDEPPDPSLSISEELKRSNLLADQDATNQQLTIVMRYSQQAAVEQGDQGHLAWLGWYRAREGEGRLDPLVTYNVSDNDDIGDELRKEEQDCVHTSNVEATNKLIDDLAAILNSNYTRAGVCCMVAVLANTVPNSRGSITKGTGALLDLLTGMRTAISLALALNKLQMFAKLSLANLFDTSDFMNYSRHLALRHLAKFVDQTIRKLAQSLKDLLTGQSEGVRDIFRKCPPLATLIQTITKFLHDAATLYLTEVEKEMDRVYNRTESDEQLNAHLADAWQYGYWEKTLSNLIGILQAAHDCVPGEEPSTTDLFNQILATTPTSVAETKIEALDAVGSRFSSFGSPTGVLTASGVQIPSVLAAREQARLENETQIVGQCLQEHGTLGAELVKATQTTIERVRDERVRERLRKQQQLRRQPPR